MVLSGYLCTVFCDVIQLEYKPFYSHQDKRGDLDQDSEDSRSDYELWRAANVAENKSSPYPWPQSYQSLQYLPQGMGSSGMANALLQIEEVSDNSIVFALYTCSASLWHYDCDLDLGVSINAYIL